MTVPVFIHVGFANTGTTSLQLNFFANRKDLFFAGQPYYERGGIFTSITSVEDFKFDSAHIEEECERHIHAVSGDRPIVVSDESLVDGHELYFAPYMMPRDVIALRLKRLFPNAKIIFTIRDQRRYVTSMYLNLKRNAAFFDRMPVPSFSRWLSGTLSSTRPHNLNFLECIDLYANISGAENIFVLPLETAIFDGTATYLGKLCEFMGLELTDADVQNYATPQNRRMSARRDLVADLITDPRFDRFLASLVDSFGQDKVDEFLDNEAPASIVLQPSDEALLRSCIGPGNWLLARQFDLELERYGYPMMDKTEFSAAQLAVAEEHANFVNDMKHLREGRSAEHAAGLRRDAEILSIRTRLAEFSAVSRSPVWRAVHWLDRARRALPQLPHNRRQ